MKDIDLFFENPLLLFAAIPAVLFIAAAFRLRREKTILRADRAAAVLRAVQLLLIAMIAAGPVVTLYSHNTETIILADRSVSMTPATEQMDAWIEAAKRDGGEHVRVMDFAAAPAGEAVQIDPAGTDIAAAIRAATGVFSGNDGRRIVRGRIVRQRCFVQFSCF